MGVVLGIQMVLTGDYPDLDGPVSSSCSHTPDDEVATSLADALAVSVTALEAIPARFDQHLADGVADDEPGRASILGAIDALDVQADAIAALSNQEIHPYTDLLLHDMGIGLSDGRPDFEASAQEWRTPPLWGLGLVDDVNGDRFLLHDGRAATFEEAILWHGGEGEPAADAFRSFRVMLTEKTG